MTVLRCGRTSVVYPPMDLLPLCPASRMFAKDLELLSYVQMNYSVHHGDEYGHGQNPSTPLRGVHDQLGVGTLDLTVWKTGSLQTHEIVQKAAVVLLSFAVVSSPAFSLYQGRGCSD